MHRRFDDTVFMERIWAETELQFGNVVSWDVVCRTYQVIRIGDRARTKYEYSATEKVDE